MESSSDQTTIMALPNEILLEVAKNLNPRDLGSLRVTNSLMNEIACLQLLRNPWMTFTFDHYYRLLHFNDLFSSSPLTSSRSSAQFTFTCDLLTENQSLSPIGYFSKTFGTSVTWVTLSCTYLGFNGQTITQGEAIQKNLTSLLSGVNSTLQELEIIGLVAPNTAIVGITPFPVLTKLKIFYDCRHLNEEDAIKQQSFLLELAQLLPGIQILDFHVSTYDKIGDVTFLPMFFFYLGQQNPTFSCKLTLYDLCLSEKDKFPVVWLCDTTNIVDLTLSVEIGQGGKHSAQILFQWLGKKTKTLKKLKFYETCTNKNFQMEFPTLEALEEFEFFPTGNLSAILDFKTPEKFPNVRKVTTRYTCKHFKVPMPKVRDFTICQMENEKDKGVDVNKMEHFSISFPNLRTLSCDEVFLVWNSKFILKFAQLRRLNLQFNAEFMGEFMGRLNSGPFGSIRINAVIKRWLFYTGKPLLDLAQILELQPLEEDQKIGQGNPQGQDTNSEAGWANSTARVVEPPQSVNVGKMNSRVLKFKDLQNLEILKIVVVDGSTDVVDAILFLSKMKNLQCLKLLEINLQNGVQLPGIYVEELQKYHEKVVVI